MTNVFNAQSDAVIVVEKEAYETQENQPDQQALVEPKQPNFIFSNNKSGELFGADLQNLKNMRQQLVDNFLDCGKFVCVDKHIKELSNTAKSRDHTLSLQFMDDLKLNSTRNDEQQAISLRQLLQRNEEKGIEMYRMKVLE